MTKKKKISIGCLIFVTLLIVFALSCFRNTATYNPMIDLGGGYAYNEETKYVFGHYIDVPPISEVIYNSGEYLVVKQKPEDNYLCYDDFDRWYYYYPYGRDTVYYWIIYKKEHRYVGPVLKNKYKAIIANKDTDRTVGVFAKCGNKFQKNFIKHHGDDDYSIFEGKYLVLNKVRGDTAFLTTDVPIRKNNVPKDIFYSIRDSAILRIESIGRKRTCFYERGHKSNNNVEIDHINRLCISFMKLAVHSIYVNQDSTIHIVLNECACNSELFRFQSDSIAELNRCVKISGNWYAPNY